MKRASVFGIVLALSLISVLSLPFETESVAVIAVCATASIPTWTVDDDFSTDSGLWSFVQEVVNIDTGTKYLGSAIRDPVNEYLVLTENGDHQAGVIWLTRDVPLSFTVEFRYKAGGGTGADGLVFMFGKQKNYDPYDGGGLGFVTPPGGSGASTAVPGYGIEFDNWYNGENNDPSGNHIALIKDHVNNHLYYAEEARTEDNQWHSVKISVGSSLVEVYLDGGIVLTWEGTIDRTYGGLGFSAATATANNWHIIDDVKIVADAPIYIKADGSIDPSIAPIETADYVTYTLTGNVYAPIVVERDNIAIDGAKFWVEGTGVETYGSKGIDLTDRTNVAVRNTQIRNFYYGIYLYFSFDNLIQDNNMTDNLGDGIKISYSSGNSIIGNNITNNSDGIGLVISEDNRICENNASDNTYSGIYVWRSNRNRIVLNEVDFNNLGIWIGESANNIICHNNFTDNTQQSSIYSPGYSNVWNDVYPSGGNYWNDYATRYPDAEELDGSGIWNTPYVIDENNQDNYPLVSPCVLGRIAANLAEAMIGAEYSWGGAGWNWNALETGSWRGGTFLDPQQIRDGYYHYQDPDGDGSLPGEVVLRYGVDCSGLVYWAYNKAYIATKFAPVEGAEKRFGKLEFPHNRVAYTSAENQYGYNVDKMSKETTKEDLLPGDLLFFDGPRKGWGIVDHVAMYVGDFYYSGGTIESAYYPPGTYDLVEACERPTRYYGVVPRTLEEKTFTWEENGVVKTYTDTGLRNDAYFQRLAKPFGRVKSVGQPDQMKIAVKSPVKLSVTDPQGFFVTDEIFEAPDMIYVKYDTDGDGEPDDVVHVLGRKVGDYFIEVIPKPEAAPDDTYTLEVSTGNTTTVMAKNVSITDIPSVPYIVTSNETGIIPRLDPHDIGVTGLDTAKDVVGEGFSLHGSVRIFNYGSFAETFNITVYANTSVIAEFVDVSLASRNSTTATFAWNTAGFARGSYTIRACVTPVANETVTMDNTLLDDSEIRVTIPGDVNGDRDVDIFDIVRIATIYGVVKPDPAYDPNCDIDGDGDIDIFDIVAAASHYGDSW